jgi:hypothetical protein
VWCMCAVVCLFFGGVWGGVLWCADVFFYWEEMFDFFQLFIKCTIYNATYCCISCIRRIRMLDRFFIPSLLRFLYFYLHSFFSNFVNLFDFNNLLPKFHFLGSKSVSLG